jgi:hypothetical protein
MAANGAFRVATRRRQSRPAAAGNQPAVAGNRAGRRTPAVLAWVAGIVGTVVASVLSAVLGAVILHWLGQ